MKLTWKCQGDIQYFKSLTELTPESFPSVISVIMSHPSARKWHRQSHIHTCTHNHLKMVDSPACHTNNFILNLFTVEEYVFSYLYYINVCIPYISTKGWKLNPGYVLFTSIEESFTCDKRNHSFKTFESSIMFLWQWQASISYCCCEIYANIL